MTGIKFLKMNIDRGYKFLRNHIHYSDIREEDKTIENAYFAGLIEMVSKVDRVKLHGGDIDLMKSIYYDLIWGIRNNVQDTPDGLSTVGYKSQEDLYGENNPLEISLNMYIDKDIYRYTKLNYNEWMDLPPYKQRQIIKICDKKNEDSDTEARKLKDEFNKLNGEE